MHDPTSNQVLHKRPRSSPQAAFPVCTEAHGLSPILSAMTCQLSSLSNSTSNSTSNDVELRHVDPLVAHDDSDRLRQRRRIEDRSATKKSTKPKGRRVSSPNVIRLITPHNHESSSGISMSLGCMHIDSALPTDEHEESLVVLEGMQLPTRRCGSDDVPPCKQPAESSVSAARSTEMRTL